MSKIENEAQRGGITLSDVERKMLNLSEMHSMLPDIAEVNEAFDWSTKWPKRSGSVNEL